MLYLRRRIDAFRMSQTVESQMGVLQVFQVFQNSFAGVKSLGPPGSAGESGEAILGLFVESDGEHGGNLAVLYVYSNSENARRPLLSAPTVETVILAERTAFLRLALACVRVEPRPGFLLNPA
jgi:hypothetical protein